MNDVRPAIGRFTRVLSWCVLLLTATAVLGWWVSDTLGLEYWQPRVHPDSLVLHAYRHADAPADVVFIGSSLTQQGIHPATVEAALPAIDGRPARVWNLGQRGTHVITHEIILRNLVTADRKPSLVVLEVGPCGLNSSSRDMKAFLDYYAWPADVLRVAPFLRTGRDVEAGFRAMFRGLITCANRLLHGPDSPEWCERLDTIRTERSSPDRGRKDASGGSPEALSRSDRDRVEKRMVRRTRRLRLRRYQIEGPADQALRRAIGHCRELGVEIVLLEMPVTQAFRKVFRKGEDATFRRYIRGVSVELGVTLVLADAAGPGLHEGDFRDFSHLAARGAERFSRHLAETVLGPRLAR